MAKTAALTDDFMMPNTSKWDNLDSSDVTVANGVLKIAATGAYPAISSHARHDLTDSSVVVQLVQPPNSGNGSVEAGIIVGVSAGNTEQILWAGPNLVFRERVGGADDDTSILYDPVQHAWLRIRESAGTVYWDTSPDGWVWTNRRSKTMGVAALDDVSIILIAGHWNSETDPGEATFDNVNIAVPPPYANGWTVGALPMTGAPAASIAAPSVLLWETNFADVTEVGLSWGTQTGRWGQSAGEQQYYTDGMTNVSVDGSHLVIEVRQETPPDSEPAPNNYTSARVVTYQKQAVEPPVRIVGRMRMPYTKGILPAFWMVGLEPGHEFDWPRQGEVDIAELPGFGTAGDERVWTGNIHGPSQADNTVDIRFNDIGFDIGTDLSQDYHEYGIDWYPDRIIWHVDGRYLATRTQADYEALGGDWTPFSGAWPHYLILSLAIGNLWTGDPDGTSVLPQQLAVDWVKVWSLA